MCVDSLTLLSISQYGCHSSFGVLLPFPSSIVWFSFLLLLWSVMRFLLLRLGAACSLLFLEGPIVLLSLLGIDNFHLPLWEVVFSSVSGFLVFSHRLHKQIFVPSNPLVMGKHKKGGRGE